MAKEVRHFLLDNEIWIDVAIYFNGKCYTTGQDGVYAYNDPNNLIVLENQNPKQISDYAGDIMTIIFEGPLYDCINGTGEYSCDFENKIVSGLCNIFEKYGCYYELGEAWSLSLCEK